VYLRATILQQLQSVSDTVPVIVTRVLRKRETCGSAGQLLKYFG